MFSSIYQLSWLQCGETWCGESWCHGDCVWVNDQCESGYLLGPNGLCPSSYIYTVGDVAGWGSLPGGRLSSVDDIETCAGHCDANSNCCSFEYSPRTKNCNLNSECRPTQGVFEDYNFCVKGNFSVYICASLITNRVSMQLRPRVRVAQPFL